ncbi:MAG: FIST C-terminal domain-containing protein [Treponema sp.]|jgi:hypothetical protein|nr:FIST C-terminal domain-containing protein [Treponema sp.]
MIKVLNAYTEEIDDVETAVLSLLEQLGPDKNLLKNSAALVHCYFEFIESGVVEELHKRLGIPTVGTTTTALGVSGVIGDMMLSVTVLTSDDIRFSSGVSGAVHSGEIAKPVTDVYKEVTAGFAVKPALLLAFPPLLKGEGQGGDVFVAELDKASGGDMPLFGTLPITNESGERMSVVIYEGKVYESSMALLALYGDLKPEFYTVAVTEKSFQAKRAKITGAKLNIIETINGIPVDKYLESIGLPPASVPYNIPLLLHEEDGSKVFRTGLKVHDDGSLSISGLMPKKAEISFCSIDAGDVVESTGNLLKSIMESNAAENRGVLIYACGSRFWILGPRWRDELDSAASVIGMWVPCLFVYSGGEVFPSILENGNVSNHLQNFSVIVCVL